MASFDAIEKTYAFGQDVGGNDDLGRHARSGEKTCSEGRRSWLEEQRRDARLRL